MRPAANPEEHGWYFNSEAIATVRQVEYLRVHAGVNLPSIRLILRLVEDLDTSSRRDSDRDPPCLAVKTRSRNGRVLALGQYPGK